MNDRLEELMDLYHDDELCEGLTSELSQLLMDSDEARKVFVADARFRGLIHLAVLERAMTDASQPRYAGHVPSWRQPKIVIGMALLTVAAVCLLMLSVMFNQENRVEHIATLISSEDAAWESDLPTSPGSTLGEGVLRLKSGVATIRFESGAEVVLSSPAQLELISDMKGKLVSGAAVVDVPESAIGFVVETPSAYAVDHGTRFTVRVRPDKGLAEFEVLEGEISVHHRAVDEPLKPGTDQVVSADAHGMVVRDLSEQDLDLSSGSSPQKEVVRIGTNGRAASVRRKGDRDWFSPKTLQVKSTPRQKWDRRIILSFDLAEVDLADVESARLRLNHVESEPAPNANLPVASTFLVYGMTNLSKNDWRTTDSWDDAPSVEDCNLLGQFVIPRSQKRGSVLFGSNSFFDYLGTRSGSVATFVLVQQAEDNVGKGRFRPHSFAGDAHPEAVGPRLEFSLR